MLSFAKIRKGLKCCTEQGMCHECPYSGTTQGYCTDALKRDAYEAIGIRMGGGGHTEKFADGWTPDMPLDGAPRRIPIRVPAERLPFGRERRRGDEDDG